MSNVLWKGINAVAFGSFIGFALHSWYVIPCAALGMFIGAMFPWSKILNDLQDGIKPVQNLLLAAARGILWTSCIAVSIWYFNHNVLYFVPIGVLFGFPYYKTSSWAYSEYIWGAILWGSISLWL